MMKNRQIVQKRSRARRRPFKGRELSRRENQGSTPIRVTPQRQGESPKNRTEKGNKLTKCTKKSTGSSSAGATKKHPAAEQGPHEALVVARRVSGVNKGEVGVHEHGHEEQDNGTWGSQRQVTM